MSVEEEEKERACGLLERYSLYRNELNMSSVILVSAIYTESLDKSRLYNAMRELLVEEPMLCSRVSGLDEKEPFFVRMLPDEIDIERAVHYRDDIDNAQQLSDLLIPSDKFKLSDTNPLWKLYILGKEGKELAWVYDHTIADGKSGVFFHKKLLQKLRNATCSDRNTHPRISLAKSLENIINVKPTWGYTFKFGYDLIRKKLIGDPYKSWTGVPPKLPMESRSVIFEFEPQFASKILTYCRNKGFSLTGLLHAILFQSAKSIITDKESQEYGNYVFTCPVDARRYKNSLKSEIGNYVFQYKWNTSLASTSSIESEAKACHDDLHRAVENRTDIGYIIGLLGYVNIKSFLQEEFESSDRTATAEISNLGSFDFESSDSSELSISKLNFVQGVNPLGAYITLNLVGIKNGTISGSVSVASDDEQATKCRLLRDDLIKHLQRLVE